MDNKTQRKQVPKHTHRVHNIIPFMYQEYICNVYGMKKAIEDEEYVKWMFMLGEYYRGQRDY